MVTLRSIEILSDSGQTTVPPGSAADDSNQEEISIVNAMGNGDTVEISEAARESYAAIQQTGAAAEVVNEARNDGGTVSASGVPAGGVAASGGGTVSSVGTEADSNDTDVEELEEEIASLREEIASLIAKADSEENSQAVLTAKQTELASLLAELAQMQMG